MGRDACTRSRSCTSARRRAMLGAIRRGGNDINRARPGLDLRPRETRCNSAICATVRGVGLAHEISEALQLRSRSRAAAPAAGEREAGERALGPRRVQRRKRPPLQARAVDRASRCAPGLPAGPRVAAPFSLMRPGLICSSSMRFKWLP